MRQLLKFSSKSEDHFFNSILTLLLFLNEISLSLCELLTSLRMFENQCHNGDEASITTAYKCTSMKNVSFSSSLVNLPVKFLVIGTFILKLEGHFSLVLIPQIL